METDFQSKNSDLNSLNGAQLENSVFGQRLNEAEMHIVRLEHAIREAEKELGRVSYRAKEDVENAYKYAIEGFARSLLAFKDNLETSLHIETKDVEAFKQGLELSGKQLDSAFESYGLQEITPSPGEAFDPAKHSLAGNAEQPRSEGIVRELLVKGYMLGSRVLRPASVSIEPAEKPVAQR